MVTHSILIVDDSDDDVEFAVRALKRVGVQGPFNSVGDGDEAIAYFSGEGPFADRTKYPVPTLVLLDLKMRRRSGFDVLEWLREHTAYRRLVVIVLSSSMDGQDVNRAYDLGANAYVPKTSSSEDRQRMMAVIADFWLRLSLAPSF